MDSHKASKRRCFSAKAAQQATCQGRGPVLGTEAQQPIRPRNARKPYPVQKLPAAFPANQSGSSPRAPFLGFPGIFSPDGGENTKAVETHILQGRFEQTVSLRPSFSSSENEGDRLDQWFSTSAAPEITEELLENAGAQALS